MAALALAAAAAQVFTTTAVAQASSGTADYYVDNTYVTLNGTHADLSFSAPVYESPWLTAVQARDTTGSPEGYMQSGWLNTTYGSYHSCNAEGSSGSNALAFSEYIRSNGEGVFYCFYDALNGGLIYANGGHGDKFTVIRGSGGNTTWQTYFGIGNVEASADVSFDQATEIRATVGFYGDNIGGKGFKTYYGDSSVGWARTADLCCSASYTQVQTADGFTHDPTYWAGTSPPNPTISWILP